MFTLCVILASLLVLILAWTEKAVQKQSDVDVSRCSKMGVPKHFARFTGKHRFCSLFSFSVNFSKLLRRPFSTEHAQGTAPGKCSVKKMFFNFFPKFYKETPVSKPFFKGCKLWACNFIKKRLWEEPFQVNFGKLL